MPPLPISGVVDITQCSRYYSACCTQEEMFQRNKGLSKVSSLQMVAQEFDLSAHDSRVLLSWRLQQRRLFSRQVWFPTRGLRLGTDWFQPLSRPRCCWRLDSSRAPKRAPTFLAARVGGTEGHLLCLLRSQPGFPEARIVVTCEPPPGLNFGHSVAWLCLSSIKSHVGMSLSGG